MNKKQIIVIFVLVIAIGLAFLAFGGNNQTPQERTLVETQAELSNERNRVVIPFREEGQLATLTLMAHGFEEAETLSDVFGETQSKDDTVFILVDASFTNISGETFTLYPSGILLTNRDGITYDIYKTTSGGLIGVEARAIDGRELGHGIEERGMLVYEVPNTFETYALEIEKAGTEDTLVFELSEQNTTSDTEPSRDGVAIDYRIVDEEDISYAGCDRVALRIVVPDDAEQVDVDFTLDKIIEGYKSGWDDITVWAYRYSEEAEVGYIGFTKGMKEYSECD